jgi:hypothetical protein
VPGCATVVREGRKGRSVEWQSPLRYPTVLQGTAVPYSTTRYCSAVKSVRVRPQDGLVVRAERAAALRRLTLVRVSPPQLRAAGGDPGGEQPAEPLPSQCSRGREQSIATRPSLVPVQMWAGPSPVPVQMWQGRAQAQWCGCGQRASCRRAVLVALKRGERSQRHRRDSGLP